jgi:protein-S-isoprenylcysteine O-methyltransferase Ste14
MAFTPDEAVRVAWAAWLCSWMAAALLWTSRVERRSRVGADLLCRLLTTAGALMLFGLHPPWAWAAVTFWRLPPDPLWALVALTVVGFGIAWWARIALGRLWSSAITRKIDHEIVRAGPYRLVRHPIYSGILLSVIATAATVGTAAAWVGAVLIALGLFTRARVEEQFLRSELGPEQYDAYARDVPMLLPFARIGSRRA